MKRISLILILVVASFTSYSQLKIVPSGVVGIGNNNPNTYFGLTLYNNGNTTKDGIIHHRYGKYLRMGQSGVNNAVIGTSTDKIDFWTADTGHNNLYRHKCRRVSDSSLKTNIVPIKQALKIIMKLKTYTYDFVGDNARYKEFGFLAQEIETILPGLVAKTQGVFSVDYEQIIPLLVKGMQQQSLLILEQKKEIETLKEDISDIKKLLFKVGKYAGMDLSFEKLATNATLFQNKPNPFNEKTVINYNLPDLCNSASIMIFDMTGTLLGTHLLESRSTELVITASDMKPGMYMYSLIVDDVEIDTKRMILQR
jgi:hypothetical protein